MASRDVTVRLSADVSGFVAGMGKAAASAASTAGKITQGIDRNSAQINTLSNAALGLGAAMGAGVVLAVRSAANFDAAMSNVASTGADAKANIDALRAAAMEMGASTKFSATEAAGGLEELAKAGVSSRDALGGGLKGALDLAAAGGLSVAEAAETAATALVQFKLEGSDVPHIADLLAAGAGKAQGSVSDMGAALKQSGLVAAQFGLSIEETTGTLAAFASAGLIGSDAGTSFKTMLLALANPSKESAKLMGQLGLKFYDAQGKFIGVAGAADELKTKLAGLTDEQRNQALAQIFGNDAVRAANVLYSEGAAGVREWTAAVDEQGFAAQTAAEKTNNLKGDIEKLGGSLETALIKAGSGGQGPLRDLTQQVTGVVDAFSNLPPSIQQGAVAVAGFSAVGLLAVGGIGKLAVGAAEAVSAFQALRAANIPGLNGAIKGLGVAAGITAGALVALAVVNFAGSQYQAGVDKTRISIEQMNNAATEAAGGSLAQLEAEYSAIAGSAQDMGMAFTMLADVQGTTADKAGAMLFNLAGVKTETQQTAEMVGKLDGALVKLPLDKAAAAFASLAAKAATYGTTQSEVAAQLPQYRDELTALATQLGVTSLTAEDFAGWMGGQVPASIRAAAAGNAELTAQLDAMAAAANAVPKEITPQVEAMGADLALAGVMLLGDSVRALPNEVAVGVVTTGTDLSKAEVGGLQVMLDTLPPETVARVNALGTQDAQTAVQYLILTLQNVPPDKAITMVAEGTGQTVAQVQSVADAVNGVPPSKTVQVGEQGAAAAQGRVQGLTGSIGGLNGKTVPVQEQGAAASQGRVQGLDGSVQGLDGKTVDVKANVSGQGAVDGLLGSIGRLGDKTIDIVTRFFTQGSPPGTAMGGLPIEVPATAAHIGARQFAGGGYTGTGPRRVDKIPAWLSAHEYVQNDRAVDYYGLSVMEAMNRRMIPRSAFSPYGFRDGGSPSGGAGVTVGGGMTGGDVETAFLRAINRAGVVMVRRSDYSLIGGSV